MRVDYKRIKDLTVTYGDAFYLLDSVQFEENFLKLKSAFSRYYPNFNIAYSYKTNYTPKLCRIIDEQGGYAEVVSDMEMEIAQRLGVSPVKIIWNGPYKNPDKLRELLLLGGTVNVDTIDELNSIEKIAVAYTDKVFNVGIRCNFDVGDGVVSRFGIDVGGDEFEKVLREFAKNKNIHLINLQCHFAKRNIEFWPARAKGMVLLTKKVSQKIGYLPERIDIGGGLYGNMEESLRKQFPIDIPTYEDYAIAAAKVFAESFSENKPELVIEPGSALVGDCMKFVGKIETIKNIRGKTFVTVLGSQKNISMSGVNPPMEILHSENDSRYYENADFVGYTCIEGDVLYRNYCGNLAIGDYVVISNCGSYSLVMKPPFIMPNFPVLDICDERRTEVIKRAESFNDLFHTFAF